MFARLAQAEACEPNPHYRDDLQVAKLTVLHAGRDDAVLCSPDVLASYEVLGVHPLKVWGKIQAERSALGLDPNSGAPPVPKKPAQAVKLWSEKTYAARVGSSRGAEKQLSADAPDMASTAALYRNPDARPSAKKRQFTLEELKQLVHYSGAPLTTRALTISALEARGPWPNEDGPATAILCISIKGMMIEGGVCKRTIQRRIKRACHLGFWRKTREANSWASCPKCGAAREEARCGKCQYRGSSKNRGEFTRPFTYEFDLEKFIAAPRCREIHSADFRTYAEYKEVARRPEATVTPIRKPVQPDKPLPPAPAAPLPAKKTAEHEHRSTERPEQKPTQPKLTRRDCAKFMANIEQRKRGHTSYFSRADGLKVALHPGEEGYAAPINFKAAFTAECAAWQREPDAVRDALKFWGYSLPLEE